MYDPSTACGRYLTYLKNASSDKKAYRVLIRENENIIFETHPDLDKWHTDNKGKLLAEEEVSFLFQRLGLLLKILLKAFHRSFQFEEAFRKGTTADKIPCDVTGFVTTYSKAPQPQP
jgi:hypothetical protein